LILEGEAIAPSNIAIVKYWGKRNSELNLPLNSSISISLDGIYAKTKVVFDSNFNEDKIIINGKELGIKEKQDYATKVLNIFRNIYGKKIYALVNSTTNFPESSVLASSAAGIAALVYAANSALNLNLTQKDLSIIARIGSGSACRSTVGGFAFWEKGVKDSGEDSFCYQIFPENYWEDLVDIIAIISTQKKKISSRLGMQTSVNSSTLMKCRLEFIERTIPEVINSIKEKNEKKFFELTMRHSNSMHAVILDSWPSFFYLNDKDLEIMRWIQDYGKAAYTFDAGQNAHIITLQQYADVVLDFLKSINVEKIIVSKVGHGPIVLHD